MHEPDPLPLLVSRRRKMFQHEFGRPRVSAEIADKQDIKFQASCCAPAGRNRSGAGNARFGKREVQVARLCSPDWIFLCQCSYESR